MNRGLFIVLDGPDGCGKSTQARRLVARLQASGREVVHSREPGGTRIGEAIRALLLDPLHAEMTPRAEVLLYMASRAQHVEELLRPALAAGRTIVCERYLSASIAYQGAGGGLCVEAVAGVGAFTTGGVVPDLTLILDIDPREGLGRVRRERDRIEGRGIEYHEKVRRCFLDQAAASPSRFAVISAAGTEDEVESRVWAAVRPLVTA